MSKNIAEISGIEKLFDDATCTYYWSVNLWFEEEPNLKLGKCEVIQK